MTLWPFILAGAVALVVGVAGVWKHSSNAMAFPNIPIEPLPPQMRRDADDA